MKKLLTTFTIILVVLFAGCKKDDYVEVKGVCPLVISTDPVNGATSVPYNKIITATFNEKMDQTSINQSSFTLLQGTALVPGNVSYIDSDSTASFVPTNTLLPFTTYKGTIKNTVKDKRSNVMQADYVWTFTTMPVVTLISTPLIGGITTGGGAYAVGATVTVTATPSVGYIFVNWTENGTQVSPIIKDKLGNSLIDNSKNETVVSTSSNYTFPMPARNRTLMANFAVIVLGNFYINLSSNPPAGGTTSGEGTFIENSIHTVSASPNTGYTFVNWTEGGIIVSTNATYQLAPLVTNRTLVANFTPIPYTVAVSSLPILGGTTSGGGTFNYGTSVTVTAVPNAGFTFINWTEGVNIVSTNANYQFTITGNRTLVANYTSIPYTVEVSSLPILGGTTSGGGTFNSGASVTVTAVPNAGFTFINWTEGVNIVSTNANYQFTITGNRTLVANYTAIPYTVTVSSLPILGGITSGGGTFNSGASVTVKAMPNVGFTFINWTEGVTVVSTNANYQFTITGNRTLVANYTAIQYTVTVSINPSTLSNQPTGGGTFNLGASVTVTAVANTGYTFTNWTEGVNIVSTNANYQFNITGNRTLVANYTANGVNPCPPIVDLGLAGNYVILAESGISTTGVTHVTGDMGVSPITATAITGNWALILDAGGTYSTSTLVTGKIYAADYTSPTPGLLTTAITNMTTAFTTGNGMASTVTELGAGTLSGQTLVTGVYKWSSGVSIATDITLDGGNDNCAKFIFQIAGDLTVANDVTIHLINGANAKNIFWIVAGSKAALGTTVDFSGNILCKTLISLNTGAKVTGRLLAQTAVTLNASTVVLP